jgi:hypothetical protein
MRRRLAWGLGALCVTLGISGATTLWAQSGRVVSPPPAKDKYSETKWTRPAGAKSTPAPSRPALFSRSGKSSGSSTMTAAEAEALIAPDAPTTAKKPTPVAPPATPETSAPPLPDTHRPPTPVAHTPTLPQPPGSAAEPPAQIRLPDAPELTLPGDVPPTAPKTASPLPEPPTLLPAKDQAARPMPAAPAPTGPTTTRVPGEPYVTSGLMFLPEGETIRPVAHTVPALPPSAPSSLPAAPTGQPGSFLQSQLKRLIERAVGPGASQVQVIFPSPNHVRIRFAVRSEQEAPALVHRVREMPELASFTVDDVEVMLQER